MDEKITFDMELGGLIANCDDLLLSDEMTVMTLDKREARIVKAAIELLLARVVKQAALDAVRDLRHGAAVEEAGEA